MVRKKRDVPPAPAEPWDDENERAAKHDDEGSPSSARPTPASSQSESSASLQAPAPAFAIGLRTAAVESARDTERDRSLPAEPPFREGRASRARAAMSFRTLSARQPSFDDEEFTFVRKDETDGRGVAADLSTVNPGDEDEMDMPELTSLSSREQGRERGESGQVAPLPVADEQFTANPRPSVPHYHHHHHRSLTVGPTGGTGYPPDHKFARYTDPRTHRFRALKTQREDVPPPLSALSSPPKPPESSRFQGLRRAIQADAAAAGWPGEKSANNRKASVSLSAADPPQPASQLPPGRIETPGKASSGASARFRVRNSRKAKQLLPAKDASLAAAEAEDAMYAKRARTAEVIPQPPTTALPETRRSCARVSDPAPSTLRRSSVAAPFKGKEPWLGTEESRCWMPPQTDTSPEAPPPASKESWRDPSSVYRLRDARSRRQSYESYQESPPTALEDLLGIEPLSIGGPTSDDYSISQPSKLRYAVPEDDEDLPGIESLSIRGPRPDDYSLSQPSKLRYAVPEDEAGSGEYAAKKTEGENPVKTSLRGGRRSRYQYEGAATSSEMDNLKPALHDMDLTGYQLPGGYDVCDMDLIGYRLPGGYASPRMAQEAPRERPSFSPWTGGPSASSYSVEKTDFLEVDGIRSCSLAASPPKHDAGSSDYHASTTSANPDTHRTRISDPAERRKAPSRTALQSFRKRQKDGPEALERAADVEHLKKSTETPSPKSRPGPDPGASYSDLLSLREVILASLLKRFYASPSSRNHTTSPSSSTPGSHPPTSSSQSSAKPNGLPKRKRPSGRDRRGSASGSASEDDGESRAMARFKPSRDGAPLWACPFSKWKPLSYQSCHAYTLKDISRVKQHLRRRHKIALHCPVCLSPFLTEADRDSHLRERGCSPPDARDRGRESILEGVTMAQQDMLEKRVDKRLSKTEQWYSIFDILFPGHPRPESPYVEAGISHHLRSFQTFLAGEGAGIVQGVARQHLPAALRPREHELLDFAGALFEHAIPELLARYQASAAAAPWTGATTPASVGGASTTVSTTTAPASTAGTDRSPPEQPSPAEAGSGRTDTTSLSPPDRSSVDGSASPHSAAPDWPHDPGSVAGIMGGHVMTDEELKAFAQQQSLGDTDGFDGYIQELGWDLVDPMPLAGEPGHDAGADGLDGYSGDLYSTAWSYDQYGYLVNPLGTRYTT